MLRAVFSYQHHRRKQVGTEFAGADAIIVHPQNVCKYVEVIVVRKCATPSWRHSLFHKIEECVQSAFTPPVDKATVCQRRRGNSVQGITVTAGTSAAIGGFAAGRLCLGVHAIQDGPGWRLSLSVGGRCAQQNTTESDQPDYRFHYLKIQPYAEYKLAFTGSLADLAEVRRIDVRFGNKKHRMIQDVRHIRAKFELVSFINPNVFLQIHVEL